MGLPVAVFLHNRFFGLLLFSLLRRSHQVRLPLSRHHRFTGSSFPSSALPISPYDGTYTPCALCSAQLAGGCILITFMSSDIPARFIAPTPADSAKSWNQPPPPSPSFSGHRSISLFLKSSFLYRVLRSSCLTLLRDTRSSARLLRSLVFGYSSVIYSYSQDTSFRLYI